MVTRNEGPLHNLGFGVFRRSEDELGQDEEIRGPNYESGPVARALHDKPQMRMMGTLALTIVGSVTAGRLVKSGGTRLLKKLSNSNAPAARSVLQNFREIQEVLDDMQGVARTYADPNDPLKLYDATGTGDSTEIVRNFWVSKGEVDNARRVGPNQVASEWGIKDEIRQKLVAQARRLPYELPAAYVTQRAIADPLLGNEGGNDVNWYNPVDVVTDFVDQSFKNLAFMLGPFEVGTGAASHTYKKMLSQGVDGLSSSGGISIGTNKTAVFLQASLDQIGQDVVALTQKAAMISSRSLGALATGIEEASSKRSNLRTFGKNYAAYGTPSSSFDKFLRVLDTVPNPFGGFVSGVRAARQEFADSKDLYNDYEKLLKLGKDSLSSTNYEKLQRSGLLRESPLQSVMKSYNRLFGLDGFSKSEFYQKRIQGEFSANLKRNFAKKLKSAGVSNADTLADDFISVHTVKFADDSRKHFSHRVPRGRSYIDADDPQEFFTRFIENIDRYDASQAQAMGRALADAVDETDLLFSKRISGKSNPYRRRIDQKIQDQYNLARDTMDQDIVDTIMGVRRRDYNSFDMELGKDRDYLVRRSAKSAGMDPKLADQSLDSAERYLQNIGLDADNADVLRGFLVSKKEINKPWQSGGFNVFGLREVSVQSAMQRGLLGDDSNVNKSIGSLLKSSDDAAASTVPGLYETRSGNILDVNSIRQGGRRILDKLATDYKIPIVNFNPLDQMAYKRRQSMRESSMIEFISGPDSSQPFVSQSRDMDFMLLLRKNQRATRGQVKAFRGSEVTNLGIFQPTPAKSMGMAGMQARIAAGEMGYGLPGTPEQSGRIRSMFLKNNAKFQPGSIGGILKRYRHRNFDTNNPVTMAKLIRGDTVSDRKGDYRLVNNEIREMQSNTVVATKEQVAKSLDSLHKFSAKSVFPKTLHKIAANPTNVQGQNAIQRMFGSFQSKTNTKAYNGILKEKTIEGKAAFLKNVYEEENDLIRKLELSGKTEEAKQLRIARETLIGRHLKSEVTADDFAKSTSSKKSAAGLSTRMDEAVSDLYSYLAIRSGVSGSKDEFATLVSGFLDEIDQLKKAGVISNKEAVETRAAMLSTQMHFSKIKKYDVSKPVTDTAIEVIDEMQAAVQGAGSSTLGPLRSALDDIAEGYAGTTQSSMPGRAKIKSIFGISDDAYQGETFSPFGNTDVVLTPTFGQAVKQKGLRRSIVSALGFTKDPEAFSPMAGFTSHLVNRLNRYASVFGGAVDPTAFNGPADMLARGIVGQRILPLYAAGATALGIDATIGGLSGETDDQGNRVYSPYFLSKIARPVAEGQALITGLIPGGLDYEEAREQIFEGEVAVRRNRYWPLGRTPFRGQGVEYYRPSWFRRMGAAPQYAESGYSNPLERLAFGYDFSPLRPFDPYRFEREHYLDRPYPVTGDYFTGPYGPITPLLNATVGRILKPKKTMHEEELEQAMESYIPVGESGTISTMAYGNSMRSDYESISQTIGGDISGFSQQRLVAAQGSPLYTGGGMAIRDIISMNYQQASQSAPRYTGFDMVVNDIRMSNYMLVAQAYGSDIQGMEGSAAAAYGVPTLPGVMPPTIIPAMAPVASSQMQQVVRDTAYRTQELAGIYGFGFGAVRSALGFGDQDYSPTAPMLASADQAYGITRSFYDLNIGGLGDMPSEALNLNISEIIRRFIPKQRSGINFINPIRNQMGVEYPFLPGADYFTDFTRGDPFASIKEGELRLPGEVYERLNVLYSDETGKYGRTDRHRMLGNVAPYSNEYRMIDAEMDSIDLSPAERIRVDETRRQVKTLSKKNQFFEYTTLYDPNASLNDKLIERALHLDNVLTRKLGRRSSAVEDWERNNVYGPTFQQWQHPVQSFIEPMIYENTQRNIFEASGRLGFGFQFFGKTPQSKAIASAVGTVMGAASSIYGDVYESITGERFIPQKRKEQARLEEYADILTYIKNTHLSNRARQVGDMFSAQQFKNAAERTMYGIDLANASLEDVVSAVPKRKREHFREFLTAPEEERDRILSTAPRLERRMLQAAYGMEVEKLPSLEEFFSKNELPGQDWEGWHPNTNMDNIKIKIGQNQGLDLSQMGYYPQQIQQANLVNPSFPSIGFVDDPRNVRIKLESLLRQNNINGSVVESSNPFNNTSLSLSQGVFV